MTKKQHCSSSIANSLQMLGKSNFGGNQTWGNNENKDNPAWNDHQQTSPTCSIDVASITLGSNPVLHSSPEERISPSHGNRAYRSYRHVSVPLPTEQRQYQHRNLALKKSKELSPNKPSEKSEEKTKSRIRRFRLRTPRLSTPSKSNEIPTTPQI